MTHQILVVSQHCFEGRLDEARWLVDGDDEDSEY